MTWNIWHGGIHGPKETDFVEDSAYTSNTLKVLKQYRPDILLMQETYCCGMNIAQQAGYQYSWRASSNLSIHSGFPILDTIHIFKPFNSHAVVLEIFDRPVLVANIWLHYLPDIFKNTMTQSPEELVQREFETRLSEIQSITKSIDSLDLSMPVIMGGDFNSPSHLDWIEITKESHYGKVVKWPVSKWMIEQGYTDSYRNMHSDILNTLDGTWGYLNDDIISDRIDYIYFKSPLLSVVDSKIIVEDPPNGFLNSDHRPVMTQFKFAANK